MEETLEELLKKNTEKIYELPNQSLKKGYDIYIIR